MKNIIQLAVAAAALTSSAALATPHASEHAPIGVMGDHNHKQGEWMTSYRYSNMRMKGNRSGSSDVSTTQVLSDFMVAPEEMTMQMHMFGLMYGVSNKLTLMGMLPYTQIEMDHVNRMGVNFTTKSSGVGDVKFSGIYTLRERHHMKILLNAGVSLPTGSIDERDDTPAGANSKLPYPMQLGSGTIDLLPAITYTNHRGHWSWGSQIGAVIRLGENDENYRLGHQYHGTMWGARAINDHVSASIRLDGKAWGDISGSDPELNPMMVPTARTDLRGGERLDLLVGINLVAPKNLKGQRLALEFGTPIYQRLDGPQLETDYRFTIGWQWAF